MGAGEKSEPKSLCWQIASLHHPKRRLVLIYFLHLKWTLFSFQDIHLECFISAARAGEFSTVVRIRWFWSFNREEEEEFWNRFIRCRSRWKLLWEKKQRNKKTFANVLLEMRSLQWEKKKRGRNSLRMTNRKKRRFVRWRIFVQSENGQCTGSWRRIFSE